MRLTDKWFTALSENEEGNILIITGRDDLDAFRKSGKFNNRLEIVWRYENERGMPSEELSKEMEQMQELLCKAVESDKLAILTGIYTGGGERCWVFYTRTVPVFCERLNSALIGLPVLPLELSAETDSDWEEYLDMYEMKEKEDE
ncbi:MAG: DUF695 domain-containing protein [Bacteroidales bacterium]|nr:DUF695 domain-containing protein [Bacteroidales bacterium]